MAVWRPSAEKIKFALAEPRHTKHYTDCQENGKLENIDSPGSHKRKGVTGCGHQEILHCFLCRLLEFAWNTERRQRTRRIFTSFYFGWCLTSFSKGKCEFSVAIFSSTLHGQCRTRSTVAVFAAFISSNSFNFRDNNLMTNQVWWKFDVDSRTSLATVTINLDEGPFRVPTAGHCIYRNVLTLWRPFRSQRSTNEINSLSQRISLRLNLTDFRLIGTVLRNLVKTGGLWRRVEICLEKDLVRTIQRSF